MTDLDGSLARAFKDVTVVVNVLPSASTPKEIKKRVQEIAVGSGARAYFLSEFGVCVLPSRACPLRWGRKVDES